MTKISRPNILLLTADQQRYDTIGALNAPFMHTPNIDRLVHDGCAWSQAHSPNPVCIPARHNILTGLPARYHGLPHNKLNPLPARLPMLPRLLSEHGYTTGAIGKMHFHPVRAHHGFNTMRLMEEIPGHIEDDAYLQYLRANGLGHLLQVHGSRVLGYQQPQRSIVSEEHHGSIWVARETSRFIEANQNRPWFAWASWIAPHPPVNVPDTFADLYAGAALPPVRGLNGTERPDARRFRELYYAAISLVDKGVGMVLDKLDELDMADNTLVIYTSDHGEMLGDLGLMQKELPYDGSVRVPLIARFPGRLQAGMVRSEFADLNDILPTVLDAAGMDISTVVEEHALPDGFPGDSLLEPCGTRDRSFQYSEFGDLEERLTPRWIMLRDARWKYIYRFGTGGSEELFDMDADPHELCNRAVHPAGEAGEALARLRGRAIEHESRWGLPGAISDGALTNLHHAADLRKYRSATPAWSVRQWPAFVHPYGTPQFHQLELEFAQVVRNEPLGKALQSRLDEMNRSEWERQWKLRGGGEALVSRLFSSPAEP
jgi:arylsulfatase A-like enzyme